ncbi:MAG: DUF1028 domain-containing protein [Promethearchaeota archaeon]
MTFSIVGYDPNTGDLGVAVQSKFMCIGIVTPFAKANVGAIATQSWINTTYGPRGLEMLETGMSAKQVLKKLISTDEMREYRQAAIVDSTGEVDAFTGKDCFYWAGHIIGDNFSCQGNICYEGTVESMAKAFETQKGDLIDKLLAAMKAGDEEEKGDIRGKQAAAILVVREKGGYEGLNDRYVDIRVDEHTEPIKELCRIFELYDLTFLAREDPANLMPIEGEISRNIKQVLLELGYLNESEVTQGEGWEKVERDALEAWIGINNFESKWRDDGTIWKSIYDYMLKEKGTSFVSLRKMSEG